MYRAFLLVICDNRIIVSESQENSEEPKKGNIVISQSLPGYLWERGKKNVMTTLLVHRHLASTCLTASSDVMNEFNERKHACCVL